MNESVSFRVRILRTEDPLILEQAGEDEADILISLPLEHDRPSELRINKCSPLRFLHSLSDLFGASRTAFWLGAGYYSFHFELRVIDSGSLIIQIDMPSLPFVSFNPKTEAEVRSARSILQSVVGVLEDRGVGRGNLSKATSMPEFYLEKLRDWFEGRILNPPTRNTTLALDVPALGTKVTPKIYVDAVENLADAYFAKASYEGALEETMDYQRYRNGLSVYEEWLASHSSNNSVD